MKLRVRTYSRGMQGHGPPNKNDFYIDCGVFWGQFQSFFNQNFIRLCMIFFQRFTLIFQINESDS